MVSTIDSVNHEQHSLLTELKKLLANEYMLYATRYYNWNIKDFKSIELFKFYESQYEELDIVIDDITERVRNIKPFAAGRLSNYFKLATLAEYEYPVNQKEQLSNLLTDHEIIIQQLRELANDFSEKYNDYDNTCFVIGLMEKHTNMALEIRSYLNELNIFRLSNN